jgi:Ca2+/Na+ antiporter
VQMDSSSVPIAIGEPIGGGLFVNNIVLGAVVLCSGGSQGAIPLEKKAFLRDAGFYAGSMAVVGLILFDSKVLFCLIWNLCHVMTAENWPASSVPCCSCSLQQLPKT